MSITSRQLIAREWTNGVGTIVCRRAGSGSRSADENISPEVAGAEWRNLVRGAPLKDKEYQAEIYLSAA